MGSGLVVTVACRSPAPGDADATPLTPRHRPPAPSVRLLIGYGPGKRRIPGAGVVRFILLPLALYKG